MIFILTCPKLKNHIIPSYGERTEFDITGLLYRSNGLTCDNHKCYGLWAHGIGYGVYALYHFWCKYLVTIVKIDNYSYSETVQKEMNNNIGK